MQDDMGSGCQGRKVSMVQEVQGMMCVGGGQEA